MSGFRSPKSYPYLLVAMASIVMFTILYSGEPGSMTFPLLLFLSAKLSLIFGSAEVFLALAGKYKTKDELYRAISRAISAFGMTMCFMLLVGAYEAAKK